ncbi:MAG: glycoside hydrolase family 68 protein [Rothia sp. (in: high G+C Gram-positive bacteria)]|nr:glycoside hydrolase family 68 protein [Rothia sp. (in: high G+C Gram-positive bacteria)]
MASQHRRIDQTPISRRNLGHLMLASGAVAAAGLTTSGQTIARASGSGTPLPPEHTGEVYDPVESDFHARWTRAEARQLITEQTNTKVSPGENSLPKSLTMPDIPKDFPIMNDVVWVWDTWSLTDEYANQISYKGWDVIFSLVAPRSIPFDERHWSARIGYFFRRSDAEPTDKWTYGGHLFPGNTSVSNTEWSGSTRLIEGNTVRVFYTATTFPPVRAGTEGKPSVIATVAGKLNVHDYGVTFSDFGQHETILEPDGVMYQTQEQNPGFAFRDPFTFEDPNDPGTCYMLFEGCGGGRPGDPETLITKEDLGYRDDDPNAETVEEVNKMEAYRQRGNIGLAVATNKELTKWKMLPPILTAYGTNDQTERPQMIIQKNNYYLFTISHQYTYAPGLRGPDGVYGFVGNGIRSDYRPMNGSGLVLACPTDLNLPFATAENPQPQQNVRQFQAYSHYIQPGGLVQSFIDNVDGRRGGTLAPTVRIVYSGTTSYVDETFGNNGLGDYGYLPTNRRLKNVLTIK